MTSPAPPEPILTPAQVLVIGVALNRMKLFTLKDTTPLSVYEMAQEADDAYELLKARCLPR